MSYRTDALGESEVAFDDGTSLLVTGASQQVEDVVYRVLAEAGREEETAVLITTNRSAESAVETLTGGGVPADHLGFIDATSRSGDPDTVDGARIRYVSSTGDLTGLSLEFAKLMDGFRDAGRGERVRIGTATVSTLLMYSDVRTVFRFLHVFTSRIRSGGFLGVFAVDTGMHDEQTVNTIRAIFDAEARVDGDGNVVLRGNNYVTH